MDGILSDGRTGRLWMCKKHYGHALGLHVRELQASGLWLDVLLEFRAAVAVGMEKDNKTVVLSAQISGALEGTKRDIECTICGSKRTWHMGEAALERWMEARKRRQAASVEVSHAS